MSKKKPARKPRRKSPTLSSAELAAAERAADARTTMLLRSMLEPAVLIWIGNMLNLPDTELVLRAGVCGQHIAEHGDVLQFKVKGKTAEAFNRLAEGLACMTMLVPPDTVMFLGVTFNVPVAWRMQRAERRLDALDSKVRRLQEEIGKIAAAFGGGS